MCMVSMVYDHGRDWLGQQKWPIDNNVEIENLRRRVQDLEEAMRKAKELDKYLNTPDCESDKKRKELQDLADKLGIKIEFPK